MYLYEKIQQEKIRQKQMKDAESLQVYRPLPDKRYISVLGSAAHTYGNALAFIQNWVINLFPKDMFKTIHVNSKIAHRQLRNTPHEYVKKARPMIIFRPRIAERTEERFLKGTPLIERITDNYSTYGLTNLQPFFKDNKNDLAIKYQLQRTVMYIDVTIVLSTLMQQLDYYSYIENSVRIEHPFFLSTYLESYIPMDK